MGNLGGGLRSIDWSSQKLERFEKNFYVEDKRISALSEREVEEFRRSKDIKVRILIQVLVCFFFLTLFQGSRAWSPTASTRLRRSCFPRIHHVLHSCPGIHRANTNSMSGMANGIKW